MGLSMNEIAQIVADAEPSHCPVCKVVDFPDSAACTVINAPELGQDEALIISYHCKSCGAVTYTFA